MEQTDSRAEAFNKLTYMVKSNKYSREEIQKVYNELYGLEKMLPDDVSSVLVILGILDVR